MNQHLHHKTTQSKHCLHIEIGQLFEIIATNSLMSVGRQHCFAVFSKAQALDSHAFPRVDHIAVQILTQL